MLNSNDERRLAQCLGVLNYQLANPNTEGLTVETQLWLANELQRLQTWAKAKRGEVPDKEETRVLIAQAKSYLIARYNMTEDAAHVFIGRRAMSMRITKKGAAVKILKNEIVP